MLKNLFWVFMDVERRGRRWQKLISVPVVIETSYLFPYLKVIGMEIKKPQRKDALTW